ncbi:MAG: Abi family protein [Myxococcota bacterium]
MYEKPALSYAQQVERLRSRGMAIEDFDSAVFYLAQINYYRLRAYWIPFEDESTSDHQFRKGTSFEDVLNLYIFDRELRLHLLDAIERIEVSVRSRWAYELGTKYGPHCLLDPSIFKDSKRGKYYSNVQTLMSELARTSEGFAEHYRTNYRELLPPIWVVCELMSFGQFSKWFDSLRKPGDQHLVAEPYELSGTTLASLLRHLSEVRNCCAHHSRLWNRSFVKTVGLPSPKNETTASRLPLQRSNSKRRRLYNALVFIGFILDRVSPGHRWKHELLALLEQHRIPIDRMGSSEILFGDEFWRSHA